MRNIPQWFDEGLAVTVSEAPEFSDIQWQYLVDSNIFRPTRDELYSFKSIKQWVDAVRRYGIEKNIERKARGEPEVAPLYTAAGHEVRAWFTKAGTPGILTLIDRLRNSWSFESAYREVNTVNDTGITQ